MTKPLRDYQEKGIAMIGAEVRKGARAVCFVLSTGGGKSVVQSELIRRHIAKIPTAKILVTVHRTELVEQLYDTFVGQGLECGVIAAASDRPINPFRPVQVASIQTLLARDTVVPGVTLKIDDECGHMCADKWLPVSTAYKASGALVVGFTATPTRADGRGLEMVYDALVCPISMKELIAQGYLCPYELIAPSAPLRTGTIAQRPVDAYLAHAKGRQGVVFTGNIKAAEEFLAQFQDAGISAAIVTGEMDSGLRRQTLRQFKDREITVLLNCSVLTEGYDNPDVSCVILARAMGSISLYLQCFGRALRPAPGKTNAILIDLHGSSHSFGAPDEDRDYSLDGDGIRRKGAVVNPFRHCIGCGTTLEGDSTVCPLCMLAKPELTAPDVVNVALVKFAAKRRENPAKRAETLARWMRDAEAKGHKVGSVYYRYQAVYGEKPAPDVVAQARMILRSWAQGPIA